MEFAQIPGLRSGKEIKVVVELRRRTGFALCVDLACCRLSNIVVPSVDYVEISDSPTQSEEIFDFPLAGIYICDK